MRLCIADRLGSRLRSAGHRQRVTAGCQVAGEVHRDACANQLRLDRASCAVQSHSRDGLAKVSQRDRDGLLVLRNRVVSVYRAYGQCTRASIWPKV